MVRVMAFGTFDGLHPGHRHYLREAKRQGDELVVVVARDATVKRVKGRLPLQDETTRLARVSQLPEVSRAVLGRRRDPAGIIAEYQPRIVCLGYDQQAFTQGLAQRYPGVKIIRISAFHPERFKSSLQRSAPLPPVQL